MRTVIHFKFRQGARARNGIAPPPACGSVMQDAAEAFMKFGGALLCLIALTSLAFA
jgi:hypothetical protein